ncbi:MAG: hypothetical protein QXO21_00040 [Candidatus Anstonellales archaeon]
MNGYIKHTIECRCILQQLKYYSVNNKPLYFHFVVFSEYDKDGNIIPSFAKCPNCGIIHKVTEVGQSTILQMEDMPSLLTEEELLNSLPSEIADILKQYGVDYATLQQAKYIIEHKLWGQTILLAKDEIVTDQQVQVSGKVLIILGERLYKIESFTRTETIE